MRQTDGQTDKRTAAVCIALAWRRAVKSHLEFVLRLLESTHEELFLSLCMQNLVGTLNRHRFEDMHVSVLCQFDLKMHIQTPFHGCFWVKMRANGNVCSNFQSQTSYDHDPYTCKNQRQRSVHSKDRVETNRRTDGRTDGKTVNITFPFFCPGGSVV